MNLLLRPLLIGSLIVPSLILLPDTIYNFTISKLFAFYILTDIAGILFFLAQKPLNLRLLKHPLFLSLLVYFGIEILSSLFGVSFIRSFFGSSIRITSLLGDAHLLLFIVLAGSIFTTREDWKKVISISLFVCFGMLIFSFLQFLFPETIIDFRNEIGTEATFGNQSILSMYFLIHFFLAWWMMDQEEKMKKKFLLLMVGIATMLVLLGVKGVLFGFAFSLLVILFRASLQIRPFFTRKRIVKAVLLLIIIGGIAGAGFMTLKQFSPSSFDYAITRLTRIHTLESRLWIWKSYVRAFSERPLLGWGRENGELAFNTHYAPELLRFGLSDTWVDRAHNGYLDILIFSGLIGFTAAAVGIGLTLSTAWKERGLLGLLVSFFAMSFAEVESLPILIVIATSLATLIVLEKGYEPFLSPFFKTFFRLPVVLLLSLNLIAAGLGFSGAYLMETAVSKDLVAWDIPRFMRRFETGYRLAFLYPLLQEDENRQAIGYFLRIREKYELREVPLELLQFLEKNALESIARYAREDVTPFYALAKLEKEWAMFDEQKFYEAEKLFKTIIAVEPLRQIFKMELGLLYLYPSRPSYHAQGIALLLQVVEENPDHAFSRWMYGKALIANREVKAGIGEMEKALQADIHAIISIDEVDRIAPLFQQFGRWETLRLIYEKGLQIAPQTARFHLGLAESLEKLGLLEESKKEREIGQTLNSESESSQKAPVPRDPNLHPDRDHR